MRHFKFQWKEEAEGLSWLRRPLSGDISCGASSPCCHLYEDPKRSSRVTKTQQQQPLTLTESQLEAHSLRLSQVFSSFLYLQTSLLHSSSEVQKSRFQSLLETKSNSLWQELLSSGLFIQDDWLVFLFFFFSFETCSKRSYMLINHCCNVAPRMVWRLRWAQQNLKS